MNPTNNIKTHLHSLIDKINNNDLLEIVYQLLSSKETEQEGLLINNLSVKEKEELYRSYNESLDDINLLDHQEVKKKI